MKELEYVGGRLHIKGTDLVFVYVISRPTYEENGIKSLHIRRDCIDNSVLELSWKGSFAAIPSKFLSLFISRGIVRDIGFKDFSLLYYELGQNDNAASS